MRLPPKRTTERTATVRAAALLAVLALCGTAACGTEDGTQGAADNAADSEGPQRDDWRAWQTSFRSGDPNDGPTEANSCAPGHRPYDDPLPVEGMSQGDTWAADTSEGTEKAESRLHCDGSGFTDELLDVDDGSHHPEDSKPDRRSDFARADGLVFNDATPELRDGALGGKGQVRALDAKSRKQVWKHSVRDIGVYHSGTVVGAEVTKVTNKPENGQYDDWSPAFAPGGDLIAWDAKSGEEKWRVKTPEKQWCSPVSIDGHLLAACETDRTGQSGQSRTHWYKIDKKQRKLHRIHRESSKEQENQLVGTDGDALVFVQAKERYPDHDFQELVRVDTSSGETQRKQLPDSLAPGPLPQLIKGDLYFQDEERKGRTSLTVVDAEDGEERWESDTVPMKYPSDPAVSAQRDEVYLAGPGGRLVAYDREDGEERWRTKKGRAEDGGTTPSEMGPRSSVRYLHDVLVVSAGNTVFSVSPDEPDKQPKRKRVVDLKG